MRRRIFKNAFEAMTPEDRDAYHNHRAAVMAHIPEKWGLSERNREAFLNAPKVGYDVETIPVAPPEMKVLIDPKDLGKTYLTEITHISLYTFYNDEHHFLVLAAPLIDEEHAFMSQVFARPDVQIIGQFLNFDIRIGCGHHGWPIPANPYCTLVGQTVMNGSYTGDFKYKRGLDDLVKLYGLDALFHEIDERVTLDWLKEMKANRGNLHLMPPDDVVIYVAVDSWAAYWIEDSQAKWSRVLISEPYGYTKINTIMERSQKVQAYFNTISVEGIHINHDYITDTLDQMDGMESRLVDLFIELDCGDMTKRRQWSRLLFDTLRLDEPEVPVWVDYSDDRGRWQVGDMQANLWTKAAMKEFRRAPRTKVWDRKNLRKWYAYGDKALKYYEKFADGVYDHIAIKSWVAAFHYLTKMRGVKTWLNQIIAHAQYDGKIHPTISNTTNSGRLRNDTPMFMNVKMQAPEKWGLLAPFIVPDRPGDVPEPYLILDEVPSTFSGRGALCPPPGFVWIEADLSNGESRTGAIVAKEIALCKAFADGRDMHAENAAAYYGKEFIRLEFKSKAWSNKRRDSKGVYFESQYGGGPDAIAASTLTPRNQIRTMLNRWGRTFPGIKRGQNAVKKQAQKLYQVMSGFPLTPWHQAYVEVWDGRRVPLETIMGNPKYYAGWNQVQQSGLAGIMDLAMLEALGDFKMLGLDAKVAFQYHDALWIEVPEDDPANAREAIMVTTRAMMTQMPWHLVNATGTPVPFPADVEPEENEGKAGWRYKQAFPSDLLPDVKSFGFDIDEAWTIILEKELSQVECDLAAVERDMMLMFESGPFDNGSTLWIEDDRLVKHSWFDHREDVQGILMQSKAMGDLLRNPTVKAEIRNLIVTYRDFAKKLQTAYTSRAGWQKQVVKLGESVEQYEIHCA